MTFCCTALVWAGTFSCFFFLILAKSCSRRCLLQVLAGVSQCQTDRQAHKPVAKTSSLFVPKLQVSRTRNNSQSIRDIRTLLCRQGWPCRKGFAPADKAPAATHSSCSAVHAQHASDSMRWLCSKRTSDSDGDVASSVAITALHLTNTPGQCQPLPQQPGAGHSHSWGVISRSAAVSSHRARATGDFSVSPCFDHHQSGDKNNQIWVQSSLTAISSTPKIGAARRKLLEQ